MNVLFLTLVEISSLDDRGIYHDLLRKFRDESHNVTIITPVERRKGISTNFKKKDGVSILQIKTFNIQKTNIIEKGIGTLAIEYQYLFALKKYIKDIKFDLVLYSTPPITFAKVISYVKQRDRAYSYLLLKDIFPQNAVDMGMIKEGGFIHRQFLKKERKLYEISDSIGCMSPANVQFLLDYNPYISPDKVEENPNSIQVVDIDTSEEIRKKLREKYQLPLDKKTLVYGGNLGKPQGLDFLLETIETSRDLNLFFLIVGNGTEFQKINQWFTQKRPKNAKLLSSLPKNEYDKLLSVCDIGLIFLHKNFLIPNFPSRLLSYLEMKIPIIAVTDPNTDIGDIIEQHNCGFKVLSGNQIKMQIILKELPQHNLKLMGENGYKLLLSKYTVNHTYNLIINKFKNV